MDKQTANQDPAYFKEKDFEQIMKFIVQIAAIRGAKGHNVKWYGISDNEIIT